MMPSSLRRWWWVEPFLATLVGVGLLWVLGHLLIYKYFPTPFFYEPYVPMHRLVFLSIAAALITSEAGHYSTMFMVLFVFMEPWQGFGRIWSIIVCSILCIPADIPLFLVPPLVRESYLFARPVVAEYAVGVGPFIRPGLILTIVVAMSVVTCRQVLSQLRSEGWRPQWPVRRRPDLSSEAVGG